MLDPLSIRRRQLLGFAYQATNNRTITRRRHKTCNASDLILPHGSSSSPEFMIILSPQQSRTLEAIEILYTLENLLSTLVFEQRSVGCLERNLMTLAYNAPKCRVASASASVDVAVGANAQRARLYGHMPQLATCCCSVCQENRSSVLRVYIAGYKKKKKTLSHINTQIRNSKPISNRRQR